MASKKRPGESTGADAMISKIMSSNVSAFKAGPNYASRTQNAKKQEPGGGQQPLSVANLAFPGVYSSRMPAPPGSIPGTVRVPQMLPAQGQYPGVTMGCQAGFLPGQPYPGGYMTSTTTMPQPQSQQLNQQLPRWVYHEATLPACYRQWLCYVCPNSNALGLNPDGSQQTNRFETDTGLVYKVLLSSGLSRDVLSVIWSICNRSLPGRLTKEEFYVAIALTAVSQRSPGICPSIATLHQLPSAPMPDFNMTCSLPSMHGGPTITSGIASPPSQLAGQNRITTQASQKQLQTSAGPQPLSIGTSFAPTLVPPISSVKQSSASSVSTNSLVTNHNLHQSFNTILRTDSTRVHQPTPNNSNTISLAPCPEPGSVVLSNQFGGSQGAGSGAGAVFASPSSAVPFNNPGALLTSQIIKSDGLDDDFGDFVGNPGGYDENDPRAVVLASVGNSHSLISSPCDLVSEDLLRPESEMDRYAALRTLEEGGGQPNGSTVHSSTPGSGARHADGSNHMSQQLFRNRNIDDFDSFGDSGSNYSSFSSSGNVSLTFGSSADFGASNNANLSQQHKTTNPPNFNILQDDFSCLSISSSSAGAKFMHSKLPNGVGVLDIHSDAPFTTNDNVVEAVLIPAPVLSQTTSTNCHTTPSNLADKYAVISETFGSKPKNFDDHAAVWSQCIQACALLTQEAAQIFGELSPSVIDGVLSVEKGRCYVRGIEEVYGVGKRVQLSATSNALACMPERQHLDALESNWAILKAVEGLDLKPCSDFTCCASTDSKNSCSTLCGVCLLDVTCADARHRLFKLDYGGRSYHAQCANLWINCVDSLLPTLQPPQLI